MKRLYRVTVFAGLLLASFGGSAHEERLLGSTSTTFPITTTLATTGSSGVRFVVEPPRHWDLMMIENAIILPRPPTVLKSFRTLDACEYAKASLRLDYERSSQYKSSTIIFGCAERQP